MISALDWHEQGITLPKILVWEEAKKYPNRFIYRAVGDPEIRYIEILKIDGSHMFSNPLYDHS